jgi:hypothetical protein
MMMKTLAAGMLSIAALATPAMAQVATREPGVTRYHHPRAAYVRGAYGARLTPAASYYYGGQNYPPGPPVGAFATAPWTGGSYAAYGPGFTPAPGYYPGYYYGSRNYPPGPPVGAFATAPWVDE